MREKFLKISVIIVRLLMGVVFIFSGFVKAVDPKGFGYKIEDYLRAVSISLPGWLDFPMYIAIGLSAAEFVLGVYLLLGLRRKFTSIVTLIVTMVFTIIAILLVIFHPVADCGCFGDYIVLTDFETLLKNLVLLGFAIVLVLYSDKANSFVPEGWHWFVSLYTCIFIFVFCVRSVYYLPLIDFRPYSIGTNLREAVIPTDESAEQFSDFFVTDSLYNDYTIDIVNDTVPTFLVITPELNEVSTGLTEDINVLNDWCVDKGYHLYCLTGSPSSKISEWCYYNDAHYQFLLADPLMLKTMIRSNPGLILLRDGVIRNKWSANNLPKIADEKFNERELEESAGNSVKILFTILLWYLLPMILLIFLSNFISVLRKRIYRPKAAVQTEVKANAADDKNNIQEDSK